jgi:hypothetical protein
MAMRQKTRSKRLRKSEQLLGAGTVAKEYATGVIGPDPRRTWSLMAMVLAVVMALSFVFLGVVVIPGFLLMFAIFGAIDRPASVVVTNQGFAVFARSEFNGRPRKVLTVLPQAVLADRTVSRSGAYVQLPDLHLWLRTKQYERLLTSAESKLASTPWATPVPAGIGGNVPSGPNPATAWRASTATMAATPAQSNVVAAPIFPPKSEDGVIYCSWCGKERAVKAHAIHYCGSMERPVVYCMSCGTSFDAGANTCGSCGTPATQLSR